MKPWPLLLTSILVLGCDDGSSCKNADYSVCGAPLAQAQGNGQPWPTLSESLAAPCSNGNGSGGPWDLRGMCADGKQFLSSSGVFVGQTRYFRGEQLVGITSYTDVGSGDTCQCPFERFQGTLATVRCDAPVFEALCGTRAPETFQAAFSSGTAECQCDDSSYQ